MSDEGELIHIAKAEYDNLLQELKTAKLQNSKISRELKTIIKRNEIDKLNIETQIGFNNMVSHEKQRQELYVRLLLDFCPVLMFVFDEKLKFLLGTKSIARIIDIDDISMLHGISLDGIARRCNTFVFTEEIITLIENSALGYGNEDLEIREISTEDNRHYEISILPFYQDTNVFTGVRVIIHDITEIMMSKDTIHFLREKAAYDDLTRIYNRATFQELARELMSVANKGQASSCLFIMDIDFFKKVNDTYGHACGDLVLQNTSDIIKNTLRSDDLIGRLGGEEFGILITGISEAIALKFAEKLRVAVSESKIQYQGSMISVTVSVGIALSLPGLSYATLFEMADNALYQAKNSGRNMSVIYGKE